ncbi:MAG: PIG-L deacetylase family protein [Blastocatellia bacterium]
MTQQATRALAAMAHPDDAEIFCGGTLFHLKTLGWELGVLTMTSGDCGSATHTREEISRIRAGEAREAADFLGAWHGCAGLMDVEIFNNAKNLRRVVEAMRQFAPDLVITHSPVDYMVDHEETSRMARSAAFALAMPLYQTRQIAPAPPSARTPALYYADPMEGIDAMGEPVRPAFLADITSTLPLKLEMLSRHRSQREWLRAHHGIDQYLEQARQWSSRRGEQCGVPFAEGFRQHRGHGYPHEPVLQEALENLGRLKTL